MVMCAPAGEHNNVAFSDLSIVIWCWEKVSTMSGNAYTMAGLWIHQRWCTILQKW